MAIQKQKLLEKMDWLEKNLDFNQHVKVLLAWAHGLDKMATTYQAHVKAYGHHLSSARQGGE